jgi:chorismate dehydratase
MFTPMHDGNSNSDGDTRWRLGAVSFLNAKPLVYGLSERPDVDVRFDVPSKLPTLLDLGVVDAALTPVVDMVRADRRWRVVSDVCIGCDGETMTVRVFSRVPPHRVRRIWADPASHSSVALAGLVWREQYDTVLEVESLADATQTQDCDAVLLIGDKVVTAAPYGFTYQTDLGGAWKTLTGLPFVFAVWSARQETATHALAPLLGEARDRGVAAAGSIARCNGPDLGWAPAAATEYLTRYLSFTLDARHREGMTTFLEMARAHELLPCYRAPEFA